MKITIERKGIKQIFKYAELASTEVLERTGRDKYVTVVAFSDENGPEHAVGLMQYCTDINRARVMWIYVYSEFRRQGIGRQLLEYMIDDLRKSGTTLLEIRYSDYMMEDIEPDEAAAFFVNNGFTQQKVSEGLLCLTGKDILTKRSGNSYETVGNVINNIVPFSSCTPTILVEKAEKLKLEKKEDILVADRNISFFYETSAGVSGLVQCEKTGRNICIKRLVAYNEETVERMFCVLLEIILRRMRITERVIVPENDLTREMLKKIFPGIKGQRSWKFVIQMKGAV